MSGTNWTRFTSPCPGTKPHRAIFISRWAFTDIIRGGKPPVAGRFGGSRGISRMVHELTHTVQQGVQRDVVRRRHLGFYEDKSKHSNIDTLEVKTRTVKRWRTFFRTEADTDIGQNIIQAFLAVALNTNFADGFAHTLEPDGRKFLIQTGVKYRFRKNRTSSGTEIEPLGLFPTPDEKMDFLEALLTTGPGIDLIPGVNSSKVTLSRHLDEFIRIWLPRTLARMTGGEGSRNKAHPFTASLGKKTKRFGVDLVRAGVAELTKELDLIGNHMPRGERFQTLDDTIIASAVATATAAGVTFLSLRAVAVQKEPKNKQAVMRALNMRPELLANIGTHLKFLNILINNSSQVIGGVMSGRHGLQKNVDQAVQITLNIGIDMAATYFGLKSDSKVVLNLINTAAKQLGQQLSSSTRGNSKNTIEKILAGYKDAMDAVNDKIIELKLTEGNYLPEEIIGPFRDFLTPFREK